MPTISSYGTWESVFTPSTIASTPIAPLDLKLHNDTLYWLESRPLEQGRVTIVQQAPEGRLELLPAPYSAISQVHEYGGGSWALVGTKVFFTNFADQQIYCLADNNIKQITHAPGLRFANLTPDPLQPRLYAVCENHNDEANPINTLVAINIGTNSGDITTIASGADFYASPSASPCGRHLAWISWCHPQMPWDGTCLEVAEIGSDGQPKNIQTPAGGTEESIFQPAWSPQGQLHFVSDNSGWWNLYRLNDQKITALAPMHNEFGLPLWNFAMCTYAFLSADRIVCTYLDKGQSQLAIIDAQGLHKIENNCSTINQIQAQGNKIAFLAGYPDSTPEIVSQNVDQVSTETSNRIAIARHSFGKNFISTPEAIEFPTSDNSTAHAFFYPPVNPNFMAPKNSKPPLLVMLHGGPTAAASADLNFKQQFWTSRGFAVIDINYRGSTGYGRAYRNQLRKKWGIYDVDDCVAAVHYLVEQQRVNPDKVCIRGGSAGGYTVLAALTFTDTFKAGASYYGIGNLESLAKDTHKFESHYMDSLIGTYPEEKQVYKERSPLFSANQISCPVIFFQGQEDKIVPPEQAQQMVQALHANGTPHAYISFAHEQHGFRRAENIQIALLNELAFFGWTFEFEPAGKPPLPKISGTKL